MFNHPLAFCEDSNLDEPCILNFPEHLTSQPIIGSILFGLGCGFWVLNWAWSRNTFVFTGVCNASVRCPCARAFLPIKKLSRWCSFLIRKHSQWLTMKFEIVFSTFFYKRKWRIEGVRRANWIVTNGDAIFIRCDVFHAINITLVVWGGEHGRLSGSYVSKVNGIIYLHIHSDVLCTIEISCWQYGVDNIRGA